MEIWEIHSDRAKGDIHFSTVEDKVIAWNSVAICAEIAGIGVLVLTLDDTHIHAMVRGDEDKVLRFKGLLQQRLARSFSGICFTCLRIQDREKAMYVFMYIYRNCLDFYDKMPWEYGWGPGNIYFSERKSPAGGIRTGDFSLREQYRIYKTKKRLPQDWHIDAAGRILPECFIDYAHVERLFKSSRTFIDFLHGGREDEEALKRGQRSKCW